MQRLHFNINNGLTTISLDLTALKALAGGKAVTDFGGDRVGLQMTAEFILKKPK